MSAFNTSPKLLPVEQVMRDYPGNDVASLRRLTTALVCEATFRKQAGADGDSREMKAMQVSTQLLSSSTGSLLSLSPCSNKINVPSNWSSWFVMKRPTSIVFIEDMVHVAVKLNSRLLRPSIILPLGKYIAGSHHLRIIHNTFSKDQHGLREKDINHKDKQNYEAVAQMTSDSVMGLLMHVPDAKGTIAYLKVIKPVTDSFLNRNLECFDKIEKAWYSVFVLCYWRQWIILNPEYNLADNFITSNAYTCMELNAHSLLTFVLSIQAKILSDSKKFSSM